MLLLCLVEGGLSRAKTTEDCQRKAAQGDAEAQTHMGIQYLAGLGVPQDTTQGLVWLHRAAAQGHAEAQTDGQGPRFL
jgi:TPR repeat protein